MSLEARLADWRRTGAAEHAERFEAEARRALAGWTPPMANGAREFQRAWLVAAHDVIGRGWALDTVLAELSGDDAFQRAAALAKRIEVLARYGPDPRFAAVAAQVQRGELAGKRLANALRMLMAVPVPAQPGVVRAFPLPTPEIEALWAEVRSTPDDDSALAVLADALQLAGDLRGELLALQLGDAGDDEAARAAQCKALIARCGGAWLGQLTQVTAAATFERGVLRRLQLSKEHGADYAGWDAMLADPMLATVTDLVPGHVDPQVYARFVASPAMTSLARVELGGSIRALPPSVTHVACPERWYPSAMSVLSAAAAVRSIAILAVHLEDLLAAPWITRLTALTLGVGGAGVRSALARWPQLPRAMALTVVPNAHLPPCSTDFPWGFGITLVREGGGTVARVSGEWLLLPCDVLTALPADTVRVEVDHTSTTLVDRVRSAIARAAVEVVQRAVRPLVAVFTPSQDDLERARHPAPAVPRNP